MSRSNYDKPFYVDVGTSIVAVRCASNRDVVLQYDHSRLPQTIQLAEDACDRMNKEVEIGKPLRNCDINVNEGDTWDAYDGWAESYPNNGKTPRLLAPAEMVREALLKCREIALQWQADEADGVAGTTDKPHARSASEAVIDMEFEINAALAAPLRNCDAGTSEEQTERFKQFCRKYRRGPGPRANCKGCPVSHESQHVGCTFAWAQMPYSEGDK